MKKMNTIALTAAALLAASTASADVLWDQQGYTTTSGGTWNHYDADPSDNGPLGNATAQWFAVGDITVGGGGWEVDSITTYHRWGRDDFSSTVTQAYLHVFPKTGTLPTASNDPLASPLVTVSVIAGADGGQIRHAVTASGLDLDLAAGDYWVGLTPLFDGTFPTAHLSSSIVGDPSSIFVTSENDVNPNAFIVPSAEDAWVELEEGQINPLPGTPHDIALTINGTEVPEPTSLALLSLGGLLVARRRRG